MTQFLFSLFSSVVFIGGMGDSSLLLFSKSIEVLCPSSSGQKGIAFVVHEDPYIDDIQVVDVSEKPHP